MFSLICVWINDWINNREAGYLRRYRAHYAVMDYFDYTDAHTPTRRKVIIRNNVIASSAYPVPLRDANLSIVVLRDVEATNEASSIA